MESEFKPEFKPSYIRVILVDARKEVDRKQQLIDGLKELGFVMEHVKGVLMITDRLDSGEGIYESEIVSSYKKMSPAAKKKYNAARREEESRKRWQK